MRRRRDVIGEACWCDDVIGNAWSMCMHHVFVTLLKTLAHYIKLAEKVVCFWPDVVIIAYWLSFSPNPPFLMARSRRITFPQPLLKMWFLKACSGNKRGKREREEFIRHWLLSDRIIATWTMQTRENYTGRLSRAHQEQVKRLIQEKR